MTFVRIMMHLCGAAISGGARTKFICFLAASFSRLMLPNAVNLIVGVRDMILAKCPKCGAEMQMTKVGEVYFNLVDGSWERAFASEDEIRIYCANDHPVKDRDILTAMADLPVVEPQFGNR